MSCSVVACDVGGTSTRVALLTVNDDYTIELHTRRDFESQRLDGLYPTLAAEIERYSAMAAHPRVCVVSGAGPVHANCCRLSNLEWTIDGTNLTQRLSLPTFVINDFSAICCGIEVLQRCRPHQLGTIATTATRSKPAPHGEVSAVVGPGTGLGVGLIVQGTQRTILPSEAGHIDFAPTDDELLALHRYARAQLGAAPSYEQLLSGAGLTLLLDYLLDSGSTTATARAIAAAPSSQRPGLISIHSRHDAEHDQTCAQVVRLFVRCLGRFCNTIALACEPTAGLYLAGGILPKNEPWLVEPASHAHFLTSFHSHAKPSMRPLLASIGIALVRDPDVALYGNADWGLEQIGVAPAKTLLMGCE